MRLVIALALALLLGSIAIAGRGPDAGATLHAAQPATRTPSPVRRTATPTLVRSRTPTPARSRTPTPGRPARTATARPLTRPSATPAPPLLSLIGMETIELGRTAAMLEDLGYRVELNRQASQAALVLFAAEAVNGPMPATRAAIEALQGQRISRGAILTIGDNGDPELMQLVEREMQELLSRSFGPAEAGRLPLLRTTSSNFAATLRAALVRQARPLVFSTPTPTPSPTPDLDTLSLVGAPIAELLTLEQELNALGFPTLANQDVTSADLTLFVITEPDRPDAQILVQMELLADATIPRAAILLYDPDARGPDSAVLGQAEADVRELLVPFIGQAAYELTTLSYEDPDFRSRLEDELAREPQNLYVERLP